LNSSASEPGDGQEGRYNERPDVEAVKSLVDLQALPDGKEMGRDLLGGPA